MIFWTNWHKETPSVSSATTDGKEIQKIITEHIKVPNGLTIDYQAKKLYWADATLKKIERSDFDGTNRKVSSESVQN